MRCEDSGRARLDRELGLADRSTELALDDHLAACERCRRMATVETLVTDGLGRLGTLEPPPVQVHDRVLASLAALGWPSRAAVPAADLAWAFAVAIGASFALAVGTMAAAPALSGALDLLRVAGLATARAIGTIGRAGLEVLEPLADPVLRLLRSTRAPFDGAGGIVGAQVTTLTAFAVVVVLCTWLIGRDLRGSTRVATEDR